MQRKPALYLAGNQMDADDLAEEVAARRKIGIKAELIARATLKDLYGMSRAAAILSPDSASANPAQLTAGLLRACRERGALIAAPVEITDMAELPGSVALATRDGRVLTADHAVFCTGCEFLPQMQTKSHHVTSTWTLATGKIRKMPSWLKDTIV